MQKNMFSKLTIGFLLAVVISLQANAQTTRVNPQIAQKASQNLDNKPTLDDLVKKVTQLEEENKQLKDELAKLKTAELADYKVLDYSLGQLKKSQTDTNNDIASFKALYNNHYHIVNGIVGTSIYAGNVQVKTSQADNAKKTGQPQQ